MLEVQPVEGQGAAACNSRLDVYQIFASRQEKSHEGIENIGALTKVCSRVGTAG